MPFDGTYSDPYSLETMAKWLREHPPEKTYQYSITGGECLLGQYARAINRKRSWWRKLFGVSRVDWHELDFGKYKPIFNPIAVLYPYTFGDALHRAEQRMISSKCS